jgi:hypothetical protein
MTNIPVFSSTFPDLWDAAHKLKDEIAKSEYSDWETLLRQLDFLSEKDWVKSVNAVVPGWEKIATQDNGTTAKHTLLVLVCCMNLPEYQAADSHTKCEIVTAIPNVKLNGQRCFMTSIRMQNLNGIMHILFAPLR